MSDFIVRRHRHQRYGRPFRRVINLRGSWQVATQPLNRLSGNSATATVFRIGATPPSSDHHDPAQEAVADALRNTWRVSLCAINSATRRVFIAMYRHKPAANARRFLGDLERTRPICIRTILTEYGKASTARLFGLRWHALTRQNAFGTLCSTLGIEYRLTPPRPPQTNGMVERFNGRSEYVTMLDQAKSWGRC